MQRRNFLKAMAALPLGASNLPLWAVAGHSAKSLILVEFKGGNDGLNTVVPYADQNYYDLRPNIAIPKNQVVPINEQLGFNSAFEPLIPLWKNQQMALVNGVGYENPNRSHFRSIEIWETALPSDEYGSKGWLSDYAQLDGQNNVVIGDNIGPLQGSSKTIMLKDVEKFLNQAQAVNSVTQTSSNKALQHILNIEHAIERSADQLARKMRSKKALKSVFPKHAFGRDLQTVASMIHAGIQAPIYKVSLGSFDTHANQIRQHHRLLEQFSSGINAFYNAMQESEHWNDVAIMTYSEFGRRAKENGSKGTDHGTAAPHFILGGQVKGGIYGEQPSFANMQNDDTLHTVDFKDVYSNVLKQWWGVNPDGALAGFKAKPLSLFKT